MRSRKILSGISILLIALTFTGCKSMSPSNVNKERGSYNDALARSEDSQMLLNIVRLRYLDSPVFLQINGITTQNSLQTSAGLSYAFYNPGSANTITPNISYTETPTISYAPLQGTQFTQGMLTPVSLLSLYYLCNANWSISQLMRLTLQNIGSYYNEQGFVASSYVSTPNSFNQFISAVNALTALQRRNALTIEYDNYKSISALILFVHPDERNSPEMQQLRQLFHISKNADKIILTTDYNAIALKDPDVIFVKTRSIIAILSYLANEVQIPKADMGLDFFSSKQVEPSRPKPLLNIYSGKSTPSGSVTTYYQGYYYYVKDNDPDSKRTFILLHDLYQLTGGLPGGTSNVVLSLPVH